MSVREMLSPPKTRRTFDSPWSELDYLCKKIRYWLYTKTHKANAKRFLENLDRVLRDLPENDVAILREEGLAMFYELNGKIEKAIVHRQREIELMQQLEKEAQSPKYSDNTKAYMLRDRGESALEERRVILATLRKLNTIQQPLRVNGRKT